MEVSYEEADYWPGDDEYGVLVEIEDESWGQCAPKDFCDIFDCENQLHALYLWIHQIRFDNRRSA